MTIHSDWARVLHEECNEAFLKQIPPRERFDVGVVDGHLQLMRMHAQLCTWDNVVKALFVKPLRKLLDAGCPVVVMCFDSYDHVPVFKSMTQSTRASKQEVKVFHAHQELPAEVPDDTMLYLMNRTFKLKVIDLVVRRLPDLLPLEGAQRLLIDYRRVVSFGAADRVPVAEQGFACMGESDVKFCRYVARYGNALVHAIDGDYMPIALLYYAQAGLSDSNRIYIYRHLAVLDAAPPAAQKRARGQPAPAAAAQRDGAQAQAPPKRLPEKCWVDMQLLYAVIVRAVRTSLPAPAPAQLRLHEGQYADAAVLLMLLAGTDFSRSLPHIGPKRMWDALPSIACALVQTQCADADAVDTALALVAGLYATVFRNHVKQTPVADRSQLGLLLDVLRRSKKLSKRTKDLLPDVARVATTARNLRWVMQYWRTTNGQVDTGLDGEHGFCQNDAGQIVFADACRDGAS